MGFFPAILKRNVDGFKVNARVADLKLLMNNTKTEFFLIGTKQQLAKVSVDHLKVGNSDIVPMSPVKNLEVWFDSNLSMSDHITKTCSAAFYHLYNKRRIRQYLTKECTETLIHAFITSRLDFCNSLLNGSPGYLLHKLQRVQNKKESKYCHITPLLRTLHWLPVVYRIQFKILLLVMLLVILVTSFRSRTTTHIVSDQVIV